MKILFKKYAQSPLIGSGNSGKQNEPLPLAVGAFRLEPA